MKIDLTSLKKLRALPVLAAVALLSGCQYDILLPSGWVAEEQRDLLIWSTLLMLIIIIPVLVMSVYIPWKYRSTRKAGTAEYDPEFDHSTMFEVFIWGVPVLIIAGLATLTWIYTHKLDPYRPLEHVDAAPIEIEAVALDWKWLFIYPEQQVASVNELAIPAGRPVNIKLSASSMMNAFSVPALAGMIYAMPAMETKLHLIADKTGTFYGRSSNYSGPGYSQMEFQTLALDERGFDDWVAKVKQQGSALDQGTYIELDKPSKANPVAYYDSVMPDLFRRIVGLCVTPGKVCLQDMMMQDMNGGGGLKGVDNKSLYDYDNNRVQDGHGDLISQADTREEQAKRQTLLTQLLATDLCEGAPLTAANAASTPVNGGKDAL